MLTFIEAIYLTTTYKATKSETYFFAEVTPNRIR